VYVEEIQCGADRKERFGRPAGQMEGRTDLLTRVRLLREKRKEAEIMGHEHGGTAADGKEQVSRRAIIRPWFPGDVRS
jgi:hypothetical protein